MSSLLELLQEIDPTSSPAMAADLRAALVAISLELQRDDSRNQLSLSQWWQWLDEEGYDRDGMIQILRQFCRARIGDDDLAALTASCVAIQEQPDGMHLLLDLLETQFADLSQVLQELEAACLAEQADLEQTAGGVSKGGKIGLGVAGTAVGIGIVAVITYYKLKKRGETLQESAEQYQQRFNHRVDFFKEETEIFLQSQQYATPAGALEWAESLTHNYKSYGIFVDIEKAASANVGHPKAAAKEIVFGLVNKRFDELATADELKLMKAMGIANWKPNQYDRVTDQDCVNLLKKYPQFRGYAEGEMVKQAKIDFLKNYRLPDINDPSEFMGFLAENERFLTARGRDVLAGRASAFGEDVTIEMGGLGRQIVDRVGTEALHAVGTAQTEIRTAAATEEQSLRSEFGQQVQTDLTDTEQAARDAMRAAADV